MLYILAVVLLLCCCLLGVMYACFKTAFGVPKKLPKYCEDLPDNDLYVPYFDKIKQLTDYSASFSFEDITITSYDGLKLHGRMLCSDPSEPWLIFFHGYRSNPDRDYGGGIKIGREAGYNMLLVDQRAHGKSEGRFLTFGIKERFDCNSWVNYLVIKYGEDVQIVLYGISMGATTVLLASEGAAKNVVGIIADCGYDSPRGIILKTMKDNKFPLSAYHILRLSAKLFGGFDINDGSVAQAMNACEIPVLFIHGESDDIVPCDMGRDNFAYCKSTKKQLLTVPHAGHGISYLVDTTLYTETVKNFLIKTGKTSSIPNFAQKTAINEKACG